MNNRGHIAMYGTVLLKRGYCSNCKGFALIIGGKLACCDKPTVADDEKLRVKLMSDCPQGRRGPSARWRQKIIEQQMGRCFYCYRSFGGAVYRSAKKSRLRINWDHVSPYAYSLNNNDQNFVASCHVCNSLKSGKIFNSVDEARAYLYDAWERKGFSDFVPGMRDAIQPETPVAKVLQAAV